nr:MAG TPA: hypothetical protein [Caudoviricetes sp.]
MLGRTNTGGGSNGLALRVIGSPTQPSNPKYPTIWIQTGVPISLYEMSTVKAPSWDMGTGFVYLTTQMAEFADAVAINPFKKNSLFVKSTLCWQQTGGTSDAPQWSRMNTYLYTKNNGWVQISSTFAATLNITYPAGSTCTVTDGTTTYTAPDTSGTWTCIVGNTDTWTVSCTNGSNNASQAVSITTSGQTVSVALSYTLYLFNGGDVTANSGGWNSPISISGGTLIISGGATFLTATNKNAIDLTNFKTLVFVATDVQGTNYQQGFRFGVMASQQSDLNGNYDSLFAASVDPNQAGTYTVDVNSLSGNYFVGLRGFMGRMYFSQIYFKV